MTGLKTAQMDNTASRKAVDRRLEAKLRSILAETKTDLSDRYVSIFGYSPPKSFGPDLLRRSVTQKLQEIAYGGLSKFARAALDRLIADMTEKPKAKLQHQRRAQFGTVLVRDWKGKSHRVLILESGFSYAGETYSNLSEIARLITGTRWNGPRFFGLRRNTKPGTKTATTANAEQKAKAKSKLTIKRHAGGHGL